VRGLMSAFGTKRTSARLGRNKVLQGLLSVQYASSWQLGYLTRGRGRAVRAVSAKCREMPHTRSNIH